MASLMLMACFLLLGTPVLAQQSIEMSPNMDLLTDPRRGGRETTSPVPRERQGDPITLTRPQQHGTREQTTPQVGSGAPVFQRGEVILGNALWDRFETDALRVLAQQSPLSPPASLDLQALGFQDPVGEVDLYLLYRDNELHGIVVRPPNLSTEEFQAWLEKELNLGLNWGTVGEGISYYFKAAVSTFGEAAKSSFYHVVKHALTEMCGFNPRPSEVVLTLKAGIDFWAVFTGEVSLKFTLTEICPQIEQEEAQLVATSDE